ncbi:MAG: hypothetical protein ACBR21_28235 [Microcoleus sp.]
MSFIKKPGFSPPRDTATKRKRDRTSQQIPNSAMIIRIAIAH